MKKTVIFMLFLAGLSALKAQSPDLSGKVDSLAGIYFGNARPGGVIGVLKDGKAVYKKAFGMADLDYRIPVTDSTLFNLASVSKQFTAFLVLLLEKEKKISLDDEIHKYIPELVDYGYPVTIRELLHHTSGIPPSDILRLFAGITLEAPWDSEDEFNMIQTYHKLNYKPNVEQNYSNSGYVLLARMVERVEGKPFAQCLKEGIFDPLGMKTACLYDSPGKVILNRASGYRKNGDLFSETNTGGESYYGSSNVYASLNDMIGWAHNFSTHSLGGEDLAERLFTPADTLDNGDTISYTFGFFTGTRRGLKYIDHTGFTMGFKTQVMHFPGSGLSVILLSNDESIDQSAITQQIADLYLQDKYKPELKKEHTEIVIDTELLKKYAGSYILPDGMIFKFSNINDTLRLIIPGAPVFNMYPEKDNEFFLKDFDAQCTFVKDNRGEVNEIIWHQNGQDPHARRYNEPEPLTLKELQGYTGKYEIPELDVTYTVCLKNNELMIILPKSFRMVSIDTDFKLQHISGDKFYNSLTQVDFRRNKSGLVTGLVIADVGRLRNIEFVKKN